MPSDHAAGLITTATEQKFARFLARSNMYGSKGSTTHLLTERSPNGELVLQRRSNGACVHLGERGCTAISLEMKAESTVGHRERLVGVLSRAQMRRLP